MNRKVIAYIENKQKKEFPKTRVCGVEVDD